MKRILATIAASLFVSSALAQSAILQGGPWTDGHAPMYSAPGDGQSVVMDSGGAGGGSVGIGLLEWLQVNRGAGLATAPFANTGSGPFSTHNCAYDGPTTGQYHFLCFDANAQGGGLIAYGAGGGASTLPLIFNINGATGFTGTKTAGSCTLTITGGIITNVTGC